jgi:hypothetical protein
MDNGFGSSHLVLLILHIVLLDYCSQISRNLGRTLYFLNRIGLFPKVKSMFTCFHSWDNWVWTSPRFHESTKLQNHDPTILPANESRIVPRQKFRARLARNDSTDWSTATLNSIVDSFCTWKSQGTWRILSHLIVTAPQPCSFMKASRHSMSLECARMPGLWLAQCCYAALRDLSFLRQCLKALRHNETMSWDNETMSQTVSHNETMSWDNETMSQTVSLCLNALRHCVTLSHTAWNLRHCLKWVELSFTLCG